MRRPPDLHHEETFSMPFRNTNIKVDVVFEVECDHDEDGLNWWVEPRLMDAQWNFGGQVFPDKNEEDEILDFAKNEVWPIIREAI